MSEFLAEAQVLITPDTTKFRTLLATQITAATRGIPPVQIPVIAAGGTASTTALTAAQGELATAVEVANTSWARQAVLLDAVIIEEQAAAAATVKTAQAQGVAAAERARTASFTRDVARAQALGAATATKLAFAEAEVTNALTPLSAAQVQATRSTASLGAAQKALGAALTAGNIGLIDAASASLRLAEAQNIEATSALRAARAQSVHSASLSGVGKGGASAGLALAGVRGATLAASGPFLAGAAAAVLFAKSVSAFSSLEAELNVFKVTAGATADEMDRVATVASELGRDITLPGVAAGDAAEAMALLARAGLDVEDAISGARGTLQLATAAQIDNASAAQLAASALNVFGLEGDQAVHVADLLAGAANSAQGSIQDVGLALQQSAAAARQVGLTLEDTVALLTLLAREGLQGSDAGTSLRTALIRLINPTEKANAIIKDLGLNIRNAQGDVRPEIFAEFGAATEDLSRAERDRAAAVIFGNDAFRAQGILVRQGVRGLNEARDATNQEGEAARTAGARTEGFAGQVEALKSNLETLATTIGSVVTPVLGSVVFGLNAMVGGINSAVAATKGLIAPTFEAGDTIQELSQQLAESSEKLTVYQDAFGDTEGTRQLEERIAALSVALTDKLSPGLNNAAEDSRLLAFEFDNLKTKTDSLTTAIIVGPAERLLDAQIAGNQGRELDVLRNQRAALEREIAAGIADRELRVEKKNRLKSINSQIQAIEDSIANDLQSAADERRRAAEQAADRVQSANNAADQAFLDSLGRREGGLQNQTLIAAASEGLRDDIRANTALRNFYKSAIAEAKRTIGDARLRATTVAGLIADQIRASIAIRAAERALADALREEREERQAVRQEQREERTEGLQLNLELAEINENVAGQRRALNALISDINKQIADTKKGTNKWRELRNARARYRKELEGLAAEEKEASNTFGQQSFEFLQKQQGFAANLLGNLIPDFATAGLVGGRSTPDPGAQLQAQAAFKTASPTYGQMATEVDILKEVLNVLKQIASGRAHPEAAYQRAASGAALDVM